MVARAETSIADLILSCEAVTFRPEDPFTGTSGIITPVYTDGRALLSYQPERKKIGKALEGLVRKTSPGVDVVAGLTTSGIPWASWLAASMNVPMIYVRDRAKRHGKRAQIEGVLKPGASVVIVDDVVNTGKSLINANAAIRRAGGKPIGWVAISNYELKSATKAFRKARIQMNALTNFATILDRAWKQGLVSTKYHDSIAEWLEDPDKWAKRHGLKQPALTN